MCERYLSRSDGSIERYSADIRRAAVIIASSRHCVRRHGAVRPSHPLHFHAGGNTKDLHINNRIILGCAFLP